MRIISAQTLAREASSKALADLAQRQLAKTILSPEALGGKGKKATAATKLLTTLGGKARPITQEDLRTFKKAIEQRQGERAHLAGITASEVLTQSTAEDLARAKTEIPWAVPFRIAGGKMSFQVSASRKHGETRHIAQIELLGWPQAVGSPSSPLACAKVAAELPVKFECSCGRHRYWYRYIATIGGWNLGRPETGFPKIRNPNLIGVACKHVLRIMAELNAAAMRGQIARAITQERQRLAGKTRKSTMTVHRAQAEAITRQQSAKPRDVEKLASKLQKALAGKAPSAARKPLTRKALEHEAALARARMLGLGMNRQDADRIAASILATGGVK